MGHLEAAASLNSVLRLQVPASCSQTPTPCVIVQRYEGGGASVTPGRAAPRCPRCVPARPPPALAASERVPGGAEPWHCSSWAPFSEGGWQRSCPVPREHPCSVSLPAPLARAAPPGGHQAPLVPPCSPRCAGLPEAAAVPCGERLLPRWLVGGFVKPHFCLFRSHPSLGPPAFSSPALFNDL